MFYSRENHDLLHYKDFVYMADNIDAHYYLSYDNRYIVQKVWNWIICSQRYGLNTIDKQWGSILVKYTEVISEV